jgi:glycosyltransferase involved in cell wall biosynthesis
VTKITAIVCSHNRWPFLEKCLSALLSQTLSPDSYEVVVVDNCSTDGTREAVASMAAADRRIVYAFEGRLGLSAARNAGLRTAKSDLVAYTDDDAEPYPDWLERIVEIFETVKPRPAIVGGEIEPVWGAPRPGWLDGLPMRMVAARLGWSEHPVFLDLAKTFVCEANCAYPRSILERYGPWPESLGRVGAFLLSNENAINRTIFEQEKFVYFDPAVRVRHHIHADRLNLRWMARRYFWQGVSSAVIMESRGALAGQDRNKISAQLSKLTKRLHGEISDHLPKPEIHAALQDYLRLGRYCQQLGLVVEPPAQPL